MDYTTYEIQYRFLAAARRDEPERLQFVSYQSDPIDAGGLIARAMARALAASPEFGEVRLVAKQPVEVELDPTGP